jgi:two-component system chemotaxis response regulator CheB
MATDGPTLIVVGASAGGVETLTRLVKDLPADLPAAIVIVLHVPPSGTSVLPAILNRHGSLPAEPARHGATLEPGHIYVAPPDNHVLVEDGTLSLDRGPKQNGHRPAVDPLFESAARLTGRRVVGVILSGTLDDGVVGLGRIKLHGGLTVVQDPEDALYPSMPANALDRVDVDHVVPLSDMAGLLAELVSNAPVPDPAPAPLRTAPPMRGGGELDAGPSMPEGHAAGLSCPDCGGTLWSVGDGSVQRFRCRIGHVYSEQSLLEEQGKSLEMALWTALRALEERAALLHRMARRARESGQQRSARSFGEHARELEDRAETIRLHVVPPALESDPQTAAGA